MRIENNKLCVVCTNEQKLQQAEIFSQTYELPLFKEKQPDYALQLCFEPEHIALFDSELNTDIHVDFIEGPTAHRHQFGGGRGQAIAKAIGLKHGITPTVLDITAGLARDAYVLATLGCKVTLVEQSPVLYTLIKDGIERALSTDKEHSVKNITNLVLANSLTHMRHTDSETPPDVIYIDPMYPERKKSALVKKDMQILHKLIGPGENENELLDAALELAKYRVVTKRPVHAEPLGNTKPTTSISSKKTRYDIYITGGTK